MEETQLIRGCQAGDLAHFNGLVEIYQQQVYNLALRMLHDMAAAEDATQETFLSAYRGIRKFRGGNFKAWLLRIAANVCRDHLRSARRHPIDSLDNFTSDVQIQHSLTSLTESPEDYALRGELGRIINSGLGSLPADQRLAVILCDIQGLSYEEVAKVAACSVGTVKSRISRGRARLRDYLLRHGELLP